MMDVNVDLLQWFINFFGKKKSVANISGYVKPKIRITQKYTLLL